ADFSSSVRPKPNLQLSSTTLIQPVRSCGGAFVEFRLSGYLCELTDRLEFHDARLCPRSAGPSGVGEAGRIHHGRTLAPSFLGMNRPGTRAMLLAARALW